MFDFVAIFFEVNANFALENALVVRGTSKESQCSSAAESAVRSVAR